jgi:hydroxypyruvate reductase
MSSKIDLRQVAAEIQRAALLAADPAEAIRRHVRRVTDWLLIGDTCYHLPEIEHVFVVALGKAAAAMSDAITDFFDDRVAGGLVVTQSFDARYSPFDIVIGGHPIPNANSVLAGQRIAGLLADASEGDLVVCLISGGSSALATLPVEGVTLADLQTLTDALLRSGATINELNAVRKHLDRVKGGGIARMADAKRASVLALILSDVVGDPLDVIASGPTTPDPTTFADAWRVLEQRGLIEITPPGIRDHLRAGMRGDSNATETPKPGDALFERVQNIVVGSNRQAAQAAVTRAEQLGFNALLLSTFVEGEARQVARVVAALAKQVVRFDQPVKKPACLVWGGETTVTVRGHGLGGRNQELALAAAIALDGWGGVLVEALGTDGTDGPTDAAGAIATGDTLSRARALELDAAAMLADNDAYHFFASLNDLVMTGPTGTNVNDLLFMLISNVE